MQKKSFIRNLRAILTAQMIFLGILAAVLIFSMWRTNRENLETSTDNAVTLYGTMLEDHLTQATGILDNLTLNLDSELAALSSDDEAARYYAQISVIDRLKDVMVQDTTVDALMVLEKEYDTWLRSCGQDVSAADQAALGAFAEDLLDSNDRSGSWRVLSLDGGLYLYKAYLTNTRILVGFIRMENFLAETEEDALVHISLCLTDEEERVWGVFGEEPDGWSAGEVPSAVRSLVLVRDRALAGCELRIVGYMEVSSLLVQVQAGFAVMILMTLVAVIFSWLIIRYARRQIIRPMEDMTRQLESMNAGSEHYRIDTEYGSREFQFLRNTFNHMAEENIELRRIYYEHQLELRDVELQRIRLQLRPHFFLNSLTTVRNLSIQGKNGEINRYIELLTRTVRYMFRFGLHTVPLSEELQSVRDYFRFQDLTYPGCVFWLIEGEEETGTWQIPQMLIHTIVENIFKHTVSVDTVVTALIRVRITETGGERLLLIEIEDDGVGYPGELLEEFREGARPEKPGDGQHQGLWSLWTMLRLMYGREDLMELGRAKPQGARTVFRVPEHTVSGQELTG